MGIAHIKDYNGKHVHFIGIGGISMSGLAEILLSRGYVISGSDQQHSSITARLEGKGVKIYNGHKEEHVHGADLVIYTAAVKPDNPERAEAEQLGLPILDRASLLGQMMEDYTYSVGIAGTHGKTTTTSMLSIITHEAKLDPTILAGGYLDAIGGNVRIGNSNYFITEACEYVDSFLKFHPFMGIILNIDSDHLDYFKDIDQIYNSFATYASFIPKRGYLIGCGDDTLVTKLMAELECHTVSYGLEKEANWMAREITYNDMGCATFRVVYNQQDMGWFTLMVPGRHNIYNALAATAAAWAMGVSCENIQTALLQYKGVYRRFEFKGKTDSDVTIIDDYAHHPTEVKASLSAAINYPHNQLWCVFQPHTYTRTKMLFKEFTEAFSHADHIIIADIYAAREEDTREIHAKDLAQAIASRGQKSQYLPSFDEIADYLKTHAQPGDIIITMGAGNIYQVGESLLA